MSSYHQREQKDVEQRGSAKSSRSDMLRAMTTEKSRTKEMKGQGVSNKPDQKVKTEPGWDHFKQHVARTMIEEGNKGTK